MKVQEGDSQKQVGEEQIKKQSPSSGCSVFRKSSKHCSLTHVIGHGAVGGVVHETL